MNDYRQFVFIFYICSLSFNFNRLFNFLKYGINIIDYHLVNSFFRKLYNFDFKRYSLNYFSSN